MKLHILLYKGDGIGPELFESLRAFFYLFNDQVSFEYLKDLSDLPIFTEPVHVLCGPLEDESMLHKTLPLSEQSYTRTLIPSLRLDKSKNNTVCILSDPFIGKTTSSESYSVDRLIKLMNQEQKVVLLHEYKEAPEQWKQTMQQWAKLAFAHSELQMEDRNVFSFIKQAEYQQISQVMTSEKISHIITAVYVSNRKALNYSYRLIKTEKVTFSMPLHGHAPDITAMGIANPLGIIFAFCGLLKDAGYQEIAQKVENQIEKRYQEDLEQTTPDMEGILNTEKYMAMIVECINL